jgi:hypothetical protein
VTSFRSRFDSFSLSQLDMSGYGGGSPRAVAASGAEASGGAGAVGHFGRSISLATPDSLSDRTTVASTPLLDMSHLTQEERSIIEDVMSRHQSEESREMTFLR